MYDQIFGEFEKERGKKLKGTKIGGKLKGESKWFGIEVKEKYCIFKDSKNGNLPNFTERHPLTVATIKKR